MGDWLERNDAAKIIGITGQSVYDAAREGRLPSTKMWSGRRIFRLEDVLKFKQAREARQPMPGVRRRFSRTD
jgi:predicted site-specific integrase-resolvase